MKQPRLEDREQFTACLFHVLQKDRDRTFTKRIYNGMQREIAGGRAAPDKKETESLTVNNYLLRPENLREEN